MALRHFLQRSEATSEPAAENDAPWLLVISHHEARLYRSTAPGAIAQLFRPHLPADFFRPAPGVKNFSRGREKPEPSSLFEPVAAVLRGAGRILIFGGGTGVGGAMEQFVAWANACRPELAGRIIGAVSAYESNLSEEQLLAKARAYHAGALVV
jgi:hypothetical protein